LKAWNLLNRLYIYILYNKLRPLVPLGESVGCMSTTVEKRTAGESPQLVRVENEEKSTVT